MKFSANDTAARDTRRIKGATNPPVALRILAQRVAVKDAHIRLKFITPRLDAKCLLP